MAKTRFSGTAPKKSLDSRLFQTWAQAFFHYLETETKTTNPALFELLRWLGRDGRQEVALSIYNFLRPKLWKEFSKERQKAGQRAKRMLSKARRDLRRAAASYQRLFGELPELGFGTLLGKDGLAWLPNCLEREATRLTEQIDKCKVFSKKRAGIKENHAILFRLQEFIEEFGRLHAHQLPASVVCSLTPESLADLIEAGKSAAEWSDTETSAETIDKALRRFRGHEHNTRLCQILADDARKACQSLNSSRVLRS